MFKFADDTIVAELIERGDETDYRNQIAELVERCSTNNLELDVTGKKFWSWSGGVVLILSGSRGERPDTLHDCLARQRHRTG